MNVPELRSSGLSPGCGGFSFVQMSVSAGCRAPELLLGASPARVGGPPANRLHCSRVIPCLPWVNLQGLRLEPSGERRSFLSSPAPSARPSSLPRVFPRGDAAGGARKTESVLQGPQHQARLSLRMAPEQRGMCRFRPPLLGCGLSVPPHIRPFPGSHGSQGQQNEEEESSRTQRRLSASRSGENTGTRQTESRLLHHMAQWPMVDLEWDSWEHLMSPLSFCH